MRQFAARPPRGSLTNLATGEFREFRANPEKFKRQITADYTRVSVPGLSHKRLQYTGTNNPTVQLNLFHHELIEADIQVPLDADLFFLESLIYPQQGQGVPSAGTPEVLFVWPRVISLRAVVTSVNFDYQRFATTDGRAIQAVAELTLEEYRIRRITSDEVRQSGPFRGEG